MRKSRIWSIGSEDLQLIINNSVGLTEVLKKLGYKSSGGSFKILKDRVKKENLDLTKMWSNNLAKKITSAKKKLLPLEEVLVENSTYARGCLKKRLINGGIIKHECQKCGITNEWEGNPIILVLDHINGINNDNRIENLRFLCPNCNSQTDTFSGRNISQRDQKRSEFIKTTIDNREKPKKRLKRVSLTCGVCKIDFLVPPHKAKSQKVCSRECSNKLPRKQKVINRPDKKELQKMISQMSWVAIGRRYGVSDNAVRKWAISHNLL